VPRAYPLIAQNYHITCVNWTAQKRTWQAVVHWHGLELDTCFVLVRCSKAPYKMPTVCPNMSKSIELGATCGNLQDPQTVDRLPSTATLIGSVLPAPFKGLSRFRPLAQCTGLIGSTGTVQEVVAVLPTHFRGLSRFRPLAQCRGLSRFRPPISGGCLGFAHPFQGGCLGSAGTMQRVVSVPLEFPPPPCVHPQTLHDGPKITINPREAAANSSPKGGRGASVPSHSERP